LQDLLGTYTEDFPGFTFTRFDGTPVIIGRDSQSVSPVVIGVTVNPSTVTAGLSFSVDFSGMNLTDQTFFDVRFRAPESSIDQEVSNWQLGTSATHTLPAGTPLGPWTFTGVRAHRDESDHTGIFTPVATVLTVD